MIRTATLRGLEAIPVDIEIALSRGHGFRIVGLPRSAVRESRLRLKHGTVAAGFEWPERSITVNLAPADIPKESSSIELGLALAILEASGQVSSPHEEAVWAVGEIGLHGRVKRCNGVLTMAQAAPEGSFFIGPRANQYELALLHRIKEAKKEFTPVVVDTLELAADALAGTERPVPKVEQDDYQPAFHPGVDFANIKGQEKARRAMEVAAAGGHNVRLIGPPGEGKSLLAKALPTILPRLTNPEILELTKIYSARGELNANNHVVRYRPFRTVHHTASRVAIVGGGSGFPLPGEITLAHHGVLFLDELPEFGRALLESLRQPVEDGVVHLTRKSGSARYPCEFILVAAMNP